MVNRTNDLGVCLNTLPIIAFNFITLFTRTVTLSDSPSLNSFFIITKIVYICPNSTWQLTIRTAYWSSLLFKPTWFYPFCLIKPQKVLCFLTGAFLITHIYGESPILSLTAFTVNMNNYNCKRCQLFCAFYLPYFNKHLGYFSNSNHLIINFDRYFDNVLTKLLLLGDITATSYN